MRLITTRRRSRAVVVALAALLALGPAAPTPAASTAATAPPPNTVVETRYDEVVTPFTSAFLAPGRDTANMLLQDACPNEVIDHHLIPHSALAIRWTLRALGRRGPADPAHPPICA